ncbi:uncharacterized protein LOC119545816 [Drosophila subpulchrella]|uniref:uncharacterized protein LOC119545816 n=1 Tax=Drosophila subpulchrella TaxID=1486046 RepID=UPI0018A16EAC|nr:uncharacterized protein LOC119545816 [Drosophila subpulchrella]
MPQPGGDYFIIITSFLVLICFLVPTKAASYQMENYDLDMDSGGISNSSNAEEFYGGVTSLERPISWLRSANSMMGSPAGHVVMQVAKELLHRSAGNSQVLSLNLTNLLIIILLKVLIFSAGMLGAGHWSAYGYGHGRSSDSNYGLGLTSGDDYLITGFLAAQGAGRDECLYAASCASPAAAYEYAKAGRSLLGAVELFQGVPLEKPRYTDLIVLMERAAHDGFQGKVCNITQTCDGLL